MKIVDALAALVTRRPILVGPLTRFVREVVDLKAAVLGGRGPGLGVRAADQRGGCSAGLLRSRPGPWCLLPSYVTPVRGLCAA